MAHDPRWAERYAALADDLRRSLGEGWEIEHVGSTSVPELPAKPVVDVALGTPQGRRLADDLVALRSLGWTGPRATGDHHALFLHDGGVRTAIAHVFTADRWPQAHVRLFAAWLRDHPEDRDAYAKLKTRLVADGVWGREYTDAKRAFVETVVNRARATRGHPAVSLTHA